MIAQEGDNPFNILCQIWGRMLEGEVLAAHAAEETRAAEEEKRAAEEIEKETNKRISMKF